MPGLIIRDSFWVKHAFIVQKSDLDVLSQAKRYYSTATDKFTDTTPGGNFAINPLPQFTRYCDPRTPGSQSTNKTDASGRGGKGMGRYYSEAFDDNMQLINLRFGVARFNSLTTFFTGFYSGDAGQLARTGRAPSVFYTLGKAAGFIVGILSWKMLALGLIGAGYRYALQKPSSKFYYMKPQMPMYWNAVSTLFNQLAVNSGVVPRIGGKQQQEINGKYEFTSAALEKIHNQMPDIFRKEGGIDVYALANKAQRLARTRNKLLLEALNQSTNETLAAKYTRIMGISLADPGVSKVNTSDSDLLNADIPPYLKRWTATASGQSADSSKDPSAESIKYNDQGGEVEEPGLGDFLNAELDDGSMFVTFRVNPTGQVSESFSNSTGPSEMTSKINGQSASARETRFNLADGNVGDGAIFKIAGSVLGAAKDVVAGVADSLSISGLATLGGAAFVDIPNHWQSSVAQLPRANYTIDLVSPYGDPISRMLNLFLPLSCLLAGVLPLSTGKQSYTSPFLVQVFDQGRCQIQLGMIDSLSVTRGTGNLGFTNDGKVLGIQVSFSIVDMSTIMHMPIAQGFSFGRAARGLAGAALGGAAGAGVGGTLGGLFTAPAAAAGAVLGAGLAMGTFDDDNAYTQYLHTLAGMNLTDQIYTFPRAKLAMTVEMENIRSWKSNAHIASFLGDLLPAQFASAFYTGTAR